MAADDSKTDDYVFDPNAVWRERVLEPRRRAEIMRPLSGWQAPTAEESSEPLTAAGALPT
jgi:hypothetical protein